MSTMKRRRNNLRGFTLLELLTVVSIIALLSSLLVPALLRAEHSAKAAQSSSNMRQLGIALIIYLDDNGGILEAPSAQTVSKLLPKAVQCSPLDDWRSSCSDPSAATMVGSYGYVPQVTVDSIPRGVHPYWSDVVDDCSNPAVFVDPFARGDSSCPWYTGSFLDDTSGFESWFRACLASGKSPQRGGTDYLREDGSLGYQPGGPSGNAWWQSWLNDYWKACPGFQS